jgi:hypothetical protein
MTIQSIHTDLIQAAENFASKAREPGLKPGEAGRYLSALRQAVDILTHHGFGQMLRSESSARFFLCSMVKPTSLGDLHRAYISYCQALACPVLEFDRFQSIAETYLDFDGRIYKAKQTPALPVSTPVQIAQDFLLG